MLDLPHVYIVSEWMDGWMDGWIGGGMDVGCQGLVTAAVLV
jgi:hypothetical protein